MTIGKRTFYPNDKARQYVSEIMETGRISYGVFSKRFESEFAAIHSCRFAVLLNSGTSSLQVALQALKELHGWREGDEVIVPATTFVASVNVVIHNRMNPILVDVDPLYYEINPMLIERAIGSRTRAIMPVHLFGQPCDMNAIMDIARRHRLRVVEDSCEAVCVKHGVQTVGGFGDVGCFSTYMAHIVTTGIGGIATTNSPDYARKMRSLVNHGMTCDTLDGLEFDPDRDFIFDSIGHSFRVTEFEAALGLSQLENLKATISKRRWNADYLTNSLRDIDNIQLPAVRADSEHAFMMYPIVCRRDEDRNPLRLWLKENGIGSRLMLPLTNQPAYRGRFHERDYPVAEWINHAGFYIGCHQDLMTSDLDYIVNVIHDYFNEQRPVEIRVPIPAATA